MADRMPLLHAPSNHPIREKAAPDGDPGKTAGATVVWPVIVWPINVWSSNDKEYRWRVGRIVDPFGHHWEIGKPLADGHSESGSTSRVLTSFFNHAILIVSSRTAL